MLPANMLTRTSSFRTLLIVPVSPFLCFRNYAKRVSNRLNTEDFVPPINNDQQNEKNEKVQPLNRWRGISESIKFLPKIPLRDPNVALRGKVYKNELTPRVKETLERVEGFADYFVTEDEINHLIQAITHKGYGTGKVEFNERLCFLGKYAIDMFVGELMVDKYYPCNGDGSTNSISTRSLSLIKSMYVNKAYLGVMVGTRQWGWATESDNFADMINSLRIFNVNAFGLTGRIETLGEAVLAVIGAVFWCRGPSATKEFIERFVIKDIPSKVYQDLLEIKPHVFVLNDVLHSHQLKQAKKIMEQISETEFKCSFFVGMELLGFATANTAEKAQELAALNGLVQIGRRLPNY
jgi:dsRNA-specific ribonuclease